MGKLISRRPSPALIIALLALAVALAGTAYAAQRINGELILKRTIGGSKLKRNTLTGVQIKNSKLGQVPLAKVANRALHTYWAVVNNPNGASNASQVRASDFGINTVEAGGVVTVTFPVSVSGCANVAGRNNASTTAPGAGFAQTNGSAANPNAIQVRTRDDTGANVDADFHLVVVCP
jgi:hypothetical protein